MALVYRTFANKNILGSPYFRLAANPPCHPYLFPHTHARARPRTDIDHAPSTSPNFTGKQRTPAASATGAL